MRGWQSLDRNLLCKIPIRYNKVLVRGTEGSLGYKDLGTDSSHPHQRFSDCSFAAAQNKRFSS
jgi:hypothetical protein